MFIQMKKMVLVFVSMFLMVISTMANPVTNNNTKESAKEAKTEAVEAVYSLNGSIFDPNCDEAVSGASITIDGKKYYSDLSGNFSIPSLSKGEHTVVVDFVSYQSQTLKVDVDNNKELKIELKQQ